MTDRVGQQLGNYRLNRLLGEGGFAEVYLGEHIHLGTQAAIKVLHTQLASDDMELFRSEARTIARLEHPNIVRVLDFGIDGKIPYLVMSYAPNGTLRQRHPKGKPLTLDSITPYVKQIASALQYAHDDKLIHRDIKPENMLIGRRNEILLSDFGIALVAQSSRYQNTQDVVGTVAYMAPEQIQGKPRVASDQYALGVVVYEWLSGERPFRGSFTEIAVQHAVAPPPPLREKNPAISSDVEQVVLTALSKDPQHRFMNVQAFANALEQAYLPTMLISKPPQSQQLQTAIASASLMPTALPQTLQKSLEPTIAVNTDSQLAKPTVVASTNTPGKILHSAPSIIPTSRTQSLKGFFSRRAVLGGLVGLILVGSVIIWQVGLQTSQTPSELAAAAARYSGTWLNDAQNGQDFTKLIINNAGQTLSVNVNSSACSLYQDGLYCSTPTPGTGSAADSSIGTGSAKFEGNPVTVPFYDSVGTTGNPQFSLRISLNNTGKKLTIVFAQNNQQVFEYFHKQGA